MGKILSLLIIALLAWGVVFILLRIAGFIQWHSFWVAAPILLAVGVWVVLIVLAVVFGVEI